VVNKLEAGIYVITIEPECEMDGKKWLLVGKHSVHTPSEQNFGPSDEYRTPASAPGQLEVIYVKESQTAQIYPHSQMKEMQMQTGGNEDENK